MQGQVLSAPETVTGVTLKLNIIIKSFSILQGNYQYSL